MYQTVPHRRFLRRLIRLDAGSLRKGSFETVPVRCPLRHDLRERHAGSLRRGSSETVPVHCLLRHDPREGREKV